MVKSHSREDLPVWLRLGAAEASLSERTSASSGGSASNPDMEPWERESARSLPVLAISAQLHIFHLRFSSIKFQMIKPQKKERNE